MSKQRLLLQNLSIFFCVSFLIKLLFVMYSKVVITSDSLYMHNFVNDVIWGNGSIFDWSMPQAPAFFPDMLFFVPISLFTQNAIIQNYILSILQIALLFLLTFFLICLFINSLYQKILFSLLAILSVVCFQIYTNEWVFFYTTNNHFSSFIALLIFAVFIGRDVEINSRLLFVFTLVFGASSLTFFTIVLFPYFTYLLFRTFRDKAIPVQDFIARLLSGIGATFIVVCILNRINSAGNLRGRFSTSWESYVEQFNFLKMSVLNQITSGTVSDRLIFILLYAATFLVVTSHLLFNNVLKRQMSSDSRDRLTLFALLSVLIGGIVTFLSGGIVDAFFLRYFMPSFFLILLVAILNLVKRGFVLEKLLISFFFIGLCLLPTFKNPNSLADHSRFNGIDNLVSCIDQTRQQVPFVRSIIGEYWVAHVANYLTDSQGTFIPTLNTLDPFWWNVNSSVFLDASVSSDSYFNLLVINNVPGNQFAFDSASFAYLEPFVTLKKDCTDTSFSLWVFDNDYLDQSVKLKFGNFVLAQER